MESILLIPTQPGWDSAWLCTGLPARHSLPALDQNKAAQSSSRKTSRDAWGRWGPQRRILDLHVNGLRLIAGGTEKHWHPDSPLIRAQLPEAHRRAEGFRGGMSRVQAVCSRSVPAAFQLQPLVPHGVKSKRCELCSRPSLVQDS